ncbi:MAG: response regulator, partial [Candidatus Dormiibacterota bacterium]
MNPPKDRARVLVVDDDAKIVTLVAAYLEREGYEVVSAYDGLAALQQIRAGAFDAVVLDVMLPKLDGVRVAELVHEESDVP